MGFINATFWAVSCDYPDCVSVHHGEHSYWAEQWSSWDAAVDDGWYCDDAATQIFCEAHWYRVFWACDVAPYADTDENDGRRLLLPSGDVVALA